ncbi:zinc finger, CCHC-type containing protein [Tanacetum coccineum]
MVYLLTTLIPEDGDDASVEQLRKRNKWENDDYVCRGSILKDFKHTLKHKKEESILVELGSHLRIEESLRVQDSDEPKGNNVVDPSLVNMMEHNNSTRYNDNNGKRKYQDTKANPNKQSKVTCWKCGKTGHLKKDCEGEKVGHKANGSGTKWFSEWFFLMHFANRFESPSGPCIDIDCHLFKKLRCWFKTYESLNDGSILHMGNESTALLNIVNDNIGSAFMSTFKLNDSIIWHSRLGHVHFKRMQDMSQDGDLCDLHATLSLGNKKYFLTFIDDASRFAPQL